MSNDLVKRLKNWSMCGWNEVIQLRKDAADRIEELNNHCCELEADLEKAISALEAVKRETRKEALREAAELRDKLADVIGAAPTSSIHSALCEYRNAIFALMHPRTDQDAQAALDKLLQEARNEALREAAEATQEVSGIKPFSSVSDVKSIISNSILALITEDQSNE